MENRPGLPLPILAEIETAKDKLYQETQRFSLLFLPARNPLAIFADEFDFSKQTTAPRQRMPAALHVQIEDFTESLFRIEARHYRTFTNDAEQLRSWLYTLASEIRKLAVRQVADKRLDFHLSTEQRLILIDKTLNALVERWSDPNATGFALRIRNTFSAPETHQDLDTGERIPTAIQQPTTKAISERLDDLALLSGHDALAHDIGISRSSYYTVKAGGGGKTVRKKVELYLSKLESTDLKKNLD
jgi:hypothetical protein